MPSTTSIILVVTLVSLFPTPTLQQPNLKPTYITSECALNRTAGRYTVGSPYQLNLNTLLTSLISNSSSSSFYASTVGSPSSNDTVYGHYFCRHDLPLPVCNSCIQAAAKQIISDCPVHKEALVWFEQCTLFYLNSSASSSLDAFDLASLYVIWGASFKVNDPVVFAPVLKDTITRVIKEAAYGTASEGFGTEEGKVSSYQSLHSLAQCSPDRVGLLCDRCLNKALREVDICCNTNAHLAFFYPNCQLRYSVLGPFYNVSNSPPLASPPPPISQVPKDPGQPTPGNWAIATMSNYVLNLGIFMAISALMLGN